MGVLNSIKKVGGKVADSIAKVSALSPEQLAEVQAKRDKYLSEVPNPNDDHARELTNRLLACCGVEIFNAYLPQIKELYVPIQERAEYDEDFNVNHNIRYFNITKWVVDKKENSLEKLVNVYEVLSNEQCNIALVFHRSLTGTAVYLAVVNTKNDDNNRSVESYKARLADAIRGNFPGSEMQDGAGAVLPCMDNNIPYSVATATNIPTEKSEKFVSQTIEKLIDGIIPETTEKEYTIILLATPVQDVDQRKLRLAELYSALEPFAAWTTNYTYNESDSINSSATAGVNVGVSAGRQVGQNSSIAAGTGTTDSMNSGQTSSEADGTTETNTHTEGTNESETTGTNTSQAEADSNSETRGTSNGETFGSTITPFGVGVNHNTNIVDSASKTAGKTITNSSGKTFSETTGKMASDAASKAASKTISNAISNTLGKAVSRTMTTTKGVFSSINLGANFGVNFARASSVTATVGKNEGITQNFGNYNIKHALEILDNQMKRYDQSSALGMWDFAAYVLSEDMNVANNVAHSYLALTQGEDSYMSREAVNIWRGDMGKKSDDAKEICKYLRELRHPVFGLKPTMITDNEDYLVYPSIVSATTSLSGKELAYSLNFPQKSISGLPILECAEFGRNVVTYDQEKGKGRTIELGKVFHMNHTEKTDIFLSLESLKSHTFITGSTGAGKSNTVYHLLDKARRAGVHFLVIEPAKGEYKNVFGTDKDVSVYGTNPVLSPLLRINPFSFPEKIHILEHLDRLVEIFNVCWPMYAAMPAVLKSAVEKSYVDCGWDLVASTNKYDNGLYPDFADVARNIKIIIESSEYDKENKGAYKGSLLTRLQSLTTGINGLIFSSDEISNDELFEKNVIVDLSRVGSTETKSLIMGMLILKLQEFRMTGGLPMNADMRHVTVLEEAHNILRRTSIEQPTESSNIMGKSVEMIANAIAEMRTYGEGFIIADQAPGLMDMSVIRNTNTKIIMRLPDQGDRELVGKSANLNDDQISELAKLPCGVAAVYQNEWIQPVLCKVERYDTGSGQYDFNSKENSNLIKKSDDISESLLKCIMDKELFQKGDKEDLRELKSLIIRSRLDSFVKVDFLNYIVAEREKGLETLRCLIYDFLKAKDAIQDSKEYGDIHEWVDAVIEKFDPSVKDYSKKQIDLTVMLILQEQMMRDISYRDVLNSFLEVYKNGGGVF